MKKREGGEKEEKRRRDGRGREQQSGKQEGSDIFCLFVVFWSFLFEVCKIFTILFQCKLNNCCIPCCEIIGIVRELLILLLHVTIFNNNNNNRLIIYFELIFS
jgi:hypothetical protein